MRYLILALALAVATVPASAEEASPRSYSLQGHGTFMLNVPASWQQKVAKPGKDYPPTITFYPKSGAQFRVLVTPIWPARPGIKPPTEQELKAIVKHSADDIAPQAVEKNIEAKQLKGSANLGYYFTATDSAPKPGEYKMLNQGVIAVGELRVTFTILTNDGQDDIVKAALAMFAAAERR